jgi:hypothetical protein
MVDVATIMTTAVDPVAHCMAQAKLSSKASQSLDAPSSPSPRLSTTLAIDRFALSVAEGLRDARAAVTLRENCSSDVARGSTTREVGADLTNPIINPRYPF